MAGAAFYFVAPATPPAALGPILMIVATIVGWLLATRQTAQAGGPLRTAFVALAVLAGSLAAGALGFTAAQLRDAAVAAPRLSAQIGPVGVEGWVVDATMGASRPRLTLLVKSIEGVATPPRFVEISTTPAGALQPGRSARCFAILGPPSGPLAPGAYDAAFQAYFERIGGTGFSYGACRPAMFDAPADRLDALSLQIASLRRAVTETIAHASPGQGGALAAALVTGDRSLIDPETNRVFRDSGLGHMISVSGLHMGLVAGMIYGGLYFLLALIAPLALRFPIRKWAAFAAIVGTGAYLILSGNSVPAQRAFVMIAVAMGAILIDRPAITMRGLAVAALIVTLWTPEAVLTPGFQMSFAASAALVAAFEAYAAHRKRQPVATPGPLVGALQTSWEWLSGALLASTVAGLATDPFALMHFQRFALYALPTNLIATPVTSLIIGPSAVAAALLAPFGLSDWAWSAMGASLDFLVAASAVFADRPEAVRYLPRPPETAFLLWVFAVAWMCLWRGWLRLGALIPVACGLALYFAAPRPIVYVDGAGQAALMRVTTERRAHWTSVHERAGAFEAERMAQLAGLGPAQAALLAAPEGCGLASCRWRTPQGRAAALILTEAGYGEICGNGALIVARAPAPKGWRERCRPAALVTPVELTRNGGAAITETERGVAVRYAQPDNRRPWRTLAPSIPDTDSPAR
jgi:competence protein ComEC